MRAEDIVSRKMTPLPKISAEEESARLTDLLSKILRYESQQCISLEEITLHTWLIAPAESKSDDVSIRTLAR